MLIAPIVGGLLVVLVLVDVFKSALLPVATGSVERVFSRVLRVGARRGPPRWRPQVLQVSGPLVLVLTVVSWLAALLLGFALMYLPVVDDLAYSPQVQFGSRGFVEALYLSGTSLTTLGFGDVVGSSSSVRLLTVLEAACGLGVLTATLGYLPAIYTVVSELRTANQRVADLGAEQVGGAAELVTTSAWTTLAMARRDVLASRQHLQRFPVLHDFHPPYDESVLALARGAIGLWVAAHFVRDQGVALGRHVKALEQSLCRLTEELRPHGLKPGEPDHARAARAFGAARAAALDPEGAQAARVSDEDVRLLALLHTGLDAYARAHGYPLLDRELPA